MPTTSTALRCTKYAQHARRRRPWRASLTLPHGPPPRPPCAVLSSMGSGSSRRARMPRRCARFVNS
jgi:hypothetical protein